MTQTPALPLFGRLLSLSETLSRLAVWAGGAMTLASVLLVSVDVICRKCLGFTTGAANELSGYAFAVSTAWALAFATLQRANVRVDVVYQHLPVRVAAVLDWVALVALGVFLAVLTFYAFDVVHTSWSENAHANTPLGTPLWIPQSLWFIGLTWMCVVLALMLVRASVALVTGDLETLQALCGVRSAQEEADDEAAAGARLIEEERA